jgi:glutaredoxin 3
LSDDTQVTIYGTKTCGFCGAARMLLKKRAIAFEDIVITDDIEKRKEMQEKSGRSSVPQIFVGDKAIGGFEELCALEESGELDKLLAG